MDAMTTRTIGRIGISPSIREAMETIIIGLHLCLGDTIFFCDLLCRMALRAGGHGNPSLIDWRVGIHFCFNPMDAMAGGTGGRITPSSGSHQTMNALDKLFRDIWMTGPARLGDIGTIDG